MAKYRAVLLVPTIVEFENEGSAHGVTEQVKRIASGMGRTNSIHPRQNGAPYEPKVMECVVVEGTTPPDLDIVLTLSPLRA